MVKKHGSSVSDILSHFSWGTHAAFFYANDKELMEVAIPYLRLGLRNDEFCVMITSEKADVNRAMGVLRREISDYDYYLKKKQIMVIDSRKWYTPSDRFDKQETMTKWFEKETAARKKGFIGLRLLAAPHAFGERLWKEFMDHEEAINLAIDQKRMIAICAYDLNQCDPKRLIDVVCKHQLSLMKRGDRFEVIENTEREKANLSIQSMDNKYRLVTGNIPIALYSALPDENSTTTLVSEGVKTITGYSQEELLGDNKLWAEMVYEGDRELVWKKIAEHRRKKIPFRLEYRIVTKTGVMKWINDLAIPVSDENGKLVRIDGFMEDITERKRMEGELKEVENRFRLAQHLTNIGHWDWNIETDELLWSDEIEPLFGFKRGEFKRTYNAFLESVHPDDRQFVIDSVKGSIHKGKEYDIEHRIIWPDGSIHWVSETGGVVRNDKGGAVRMLGFVRDITQQKNAEENVNKLNTELLRLTQDVIRTNRELEAFSSSVSHDLRAPVRRIKDFTGILLEDKGRTLDKEGIDFLTRANAAAKQMEEMIGSLLKLSHLTRVPIKTEKVNLSSIARTTANRLRELEPLRGNVEFRIKDDVYTYGDHNLLSILIDNLMANSWKFTSKRLSAVIEFGSKMNKGEEVYFVRDNGVGFDAKSNGDIFIPFKRYHSEKDYPGIGIGLSTVSRIVDRHGGRIWAESDIDKGATFYFTLSLT